jgi:hypothetical protein
MLPDIGGEKSLLMVCMRKHLLLNFLEEKCSMLEQKKFASLLQENKKFNPS